MDSNLVASAADVPDTRKQSCLTMRGGFLSFHHPEISSPKMGPLYMAADPQMGFR